MPRANRPSTIAQKGELRFQILEDGAISNPKVERFALMLADDVVPATAWRTLGGSNDGGSFAYRKKIETDERFLERLRGLKDEREILMADDLFGEAKWMARQMWREARAKGDSTLMKNAADMRMKILEKEDARSSAGDPAPRGPGAPVAPNPQSDGSLSDVRQRLLDKGIRAPGDVGDAPATPAPVKLSPQPEPIALVAVQDQHEEMPDDFMERMDRIVVSPAQAA